MSGFAVPERAQREAREAAERAMGLTVPMPVTEFYGQYRFLSNFYIEPDGTCVEKEFQAAKSLDEEYAALIRSASSPGEAKRLGSKGVMSPEFFRPDWDDIRISEMEVFVLAKFTDHESLAKLLLQTGDRELIEGNSHDDTFWGMVRGRGENQLGKILMRVRTHIS